MTGKQTLVKYGNIRVQKEHKIFINFSCDNK